VKRLALTRLTESSHKLCDWNEWDRLERDLQASGAAYIKEPYDPEKNWLIEPLLSLSLALTGPAAAEIRKGIAIRKSHGIEVHALGLGFPRFTYAPRLGRPRLKVAYLSAGIGNHVSGLFLQSAIGMHSRQDFEIFVYNQHPEQDNYIRRQVANEADHYLNVYGAHFYEIAQRIHADNIDVVIYLDPHTTGEKLDILAYKPAPIIIHYFGYPGTTGATFVDYMISDRVVVPPQHSSEFTEKLIIQPAPYTYQVNNHRQLGKYYPIATTNRSLHELPPDRFVYCAFNQLQKVTPQIFNVWTNILRRVPHGVLWMYRHKESKEYLAAEMKAAGFHPESRYSFANGSQHLEQLSRLPLADAFLDTPIYNAHTTLTDALFSGVPPLHVTGDHMASRVGKSLLVADNFPQIGMVSLKAYEDLAVMMAQQPQQLADIRRFIFERRNVSPLFDTQGWVTHLEKGLKIAWENKLAGNPPSHTVISRT